MRSKNDMEWRVYEMQVAFEKARGGEAPKMPNLEVQTPRTAGRPGPRTAETRASPAPR